MDHWSYPVPMAMQRHTGCHLTPAPQPEKLPADKAPPVAPEAVNTADRSAEQPRD